MKKYLMAICIIFVFTSCATDTTEKSKAKAEYDHAVRLLGKGSYSEVNLLLEQYNIHHPYNQYTIQAELLRSFAAYKSGEYILAETLSTRFISRHPRHPDIAYAKYMLAMSHYKQIGPPEQDPTQTMAAIKSFKELLKDHHDSSYAKDGAKRLQLLYNRLAGHELSVGEFYFRRGRYVAAANRFQVVMQKYQTTPSIEEALYYLAASYDKLGVKDDAHDTALLLKHNYPHSDWSQKAAQFL